MRSITERLTRFRQADRTPLGSRAPSPVPSPPDGRGAPGLGLADGRLAGLLAAAAGSDDAFAAVYDALAPRVWAMTQAVAGHGDDAPAAVGQAFEDLWHAAPACPHEAEAAVAWALRVAMPHGTRPPDHGARKEHPDESVRRALLALTDAERASLLLTCYGRLTIAQSAYALDLSRTDPATLLGAALRHAGDLLRVRARSNTLRTGPTTPSTA